LGELGSGEKRAEKKERVNELLQEVPTPSEASISLVDKKILSPTKNPHSRPTAPHTQHRHPK